MQKRIISILLVLALAMLLVAGCRSGKNGEDPPVVEDTTLEGTWRITEQTYGDEIISFPWDHPTSYPGFLLQVYFQFKDGVYKVFNEYIPEEKKEKPDVELMIKAKYTVKGDTITLIYEDESGNEEGSEEWKYVITGNKINISCENINSGQTLFITAVKVADSVVENAISRDELSEDHMIL